MDFAELKDRFLVDENLQTERLAKLVERAVNYCVVHKDGTVELKDSRLPGRDQVKLVLSARLIASRLEKSVPDDVTVEQLAEYTGLPKNQAAARAKDCVDERFAERTGRGAYKARPLKVEEFLGTLSSQKVSRSAS